MENVQFSDLEENPETPFVDSLVSRVFDWEKEIAMDEEVSEVADSAMSEEKDSSVDSMLCDSSSRLIPGGFTRSNCSDEVVIFVNAGDLAANEADPVVKISEDRYFEGGTILSTDEQITEAGDYPFIYTAARFGSFCYRFDSVPQGNYFIDLHFAEIINTLGPKGTRVFNVYIQEEKALSDVDIFSVVGGNKPLQVVDLRVAVKKDGIIVIRFEGVSGTPMVSGICIRRAPQVSASRASHDYLKCKHCAAELEISSAEKKLMRAKATGQYEKKIQELTKQCQLKTNECHEAWMSLTTANEQLEKVRMDLDNKIFETRSLDETVGKQAESLKNVTSRYEHDKKHWEMAINGLQQKIKRMKDEQIQLSREAHSCVESKPAMNSMVTVVQALVQQCEDFKMKYVE